MFSQKNANSFFPTSWQVDYMLTLQSHLYLQVTSHADIHRALSQIPCPQAFVGQDCMMSQKNITQQSFIMSLKCNLGIVNLEAMLVSSFPNNAGGGMMPLAGHLMTGMRSCLLAVLCHEHQIELCCLLAILVLFYFFQPFLPLQLRAR